ncbi:MAG: ADP-ribosylglycohydrolase family protein [Candidatus Jordarchaeum sp.]|uniref:ADP-ribosylglycohydrolase family protein n=1 Tax=Candidatus Jordarchaeum sp. TaxID=2823881 RepID=UPI00404AAC92
MLSELQLKSKFVGALVGTGVGDTLGRPFEGFRRPFTVDTVKFGGKYTDDTEMAIGVAESLVEKQGFDGEHMAWTFIRNFNPSRGYGWGPPQIFKWIKEGLSWDKASRKLFNGTGSWGNGAAMRIVPIGTFYFDDFEELKKVAHQSSLITHSHILGIEGAVLQACSVALAVRLTPESFDPQIFVNKLLQIVQEDVYRKKLDIIRKFLRGKPDEVRIIEELGNGIAAFDSVPTALFSFLSHPKSFKEAVRYAVCLGGDSDTIGAMCGGISGAFHGVEGIPDEWRKNLENAEYIESLAEKLWQVKTTYKK